MALTEKQAAHIRAVKQKIQMIVTAAKQARWSEGYIIPWDNMFLTGGAIASFLRDETPKDLDFYFLDELSMTRMSNHLRTQTNFIKDVDPSYQDTIGVDGKMITANAITMKNGASFITLVYGTPTVVKNTFDFVHCTPHYSLADDKLYISESQYVCAVEKKLLINNLMFVKQNRVDKFLNRGYTWHENEKSTWSSK